MVPFDPALRFLEYHLGFETRSKSDLVSMREPWWCVFESPVGEHAIRVSPPTLFWGYYPYHHPKALYLHEVAHLYVRPPWELTPEHSMEMVAMFAWELAVSKNLVERGLWEPRDLKESVSFHEFWATGILSGPVNLQWLNLESRDQKLLLRYMQKTCRLANLLHEDGSPTYATPTWTHEVRERWHHDFEPLLG